MQQRRHSMTDLIFTLTLFCVFAVSALIVVVIGANVYRSTAANMSENYSTRTAVAYVTEKVRENDRAPDASAVELTDFNGLPALRLTRAGDPAPYYTFIYYYSGALRELMTSADYAEDLSPDAGQVIAELQSAGFEQVENGLYRFTAVGARSSEYVLLTVHTAGV